VRNSGWTPNFGKVATCVIGGAQFGQLISGDVSAPERSINGRDYAGGTRAAFAGLDQRRLVISLPDGS
jgi:hypothetical protein